jgi:hypothetical protein
MALIRADGSIIQKLNFSPASTRARSKGMALFISKLSKTQTLHAVHTLGDSIKEGSKMMRSTTGLFMQLRRRARRIALLLLLASVAPLASGCFGRFPLTHLVYKVNGGVSDKKILQTLLFWIFAWLPVYWFAMLGDALIFNLIEFWTGESFFDEAVQRGDKIIRFETSQDGRELRMTISRNGETLSRSRFVRLSESVCEARDDQDRLTARIIKAADGRLSLTSIDGKEIGAIPASALASLQRP